MTIKPHVSPRLTAKNTSELLQEEVTTGNQICSMRNITRDFIENTDWAKTDSTLQVLLLLCLSTMIPMM